MGVNIYTRRLRVLLHGYTHQQQTKWSGRTSTKTITTWFLGRGIPAARDGRDGANGFSLHISSSTDDNPSKSPLSDPAKLEDETRVDRELRELQRVKMKRKVQIRIRNRLQIFV